MRRKALSRLLLAEPSSLVLGPTGARASSPSCEYASSISSRVATPAMALLRFSTPCAWVPPAAAPRSSVRTVVRLVLRPIALPAGSTWRPGYPRSPRHASPFRAFPPSQIGAGCPAPAFLRLPVPSLPAWSRGLSKALLPVRSSWRVLERTAGCSPGILPFRASTSHRPADRSPGRLLLRASCVHARRRRHPAPWSLAL